MNTNRSGMREWVRWTDDMRWHLVVRTIRDDGRLRDVDTACHDVASEESDEGFIVIERGELPPSEYEGDTYGLCSTCARASRR